MNSEQIANMLAEQDESGYFKKALRLNKDLADLGSKFATFLPCISYTETSTKP